MSPLLFPTKPFCLPPSGSEGRVDVGDLGSIPMDPTLNNEKEPTSACSWTASPLSVVHTQPFSRSKISTNPAPAVPAAIDFCSASPAGPSLMGESQATPWIECRSRALHIFPVTRIQGVAFLSPTPAVPLRCRPDASLHSRCTTGGRLNRRPHGSLHRTSRIRLEKRATR